MSQAFQVLRIAFADQSALVREFETNLVNGGLFIPGDFELPYGEPVMVFVDLPFATASVEFEGRVVHTTPVEFEASGGQAGVAIELQEALTVIRERIEKALGQRVLGELDAGTGNRHAARLVAQVRARVRVPGGSELEGRTRNLSLAGVLVAIDGEAPPVGQEVTVEIVHPTTGEERGIPGVIARHDLDASGLVRGLGVQFSMETSKADATIAYLSQVKASEHARRLGGITGSIETLGLHDLILSFGRCIPCGRFTFMRSGAVGTVQVADGMMVSARMGAAAGVKALVRMASWIDGSFEFHANLQPDEEDGQMLIPVEAALLEAARFIEESTRHGGSSLPLAAGLRSEHRKVDLHDPNMSKVEARVLDLACVGMTVSRVLDSIQEPDGLIESAILELIEQGALRMEPSI